MPFLTRRHSVSAENRKVDIPSALVVGGAVAGVSSAFGGGATKVSLPACPARKTDIIPVIL